MSESKMEVRYATGAEYPRPVAAVTGGSAGLGLAIAAELLSAGYEVVILGRNTERLTQACLKLDAAFNNALAERPQATGLAADLTNADDVKRVFGEIEDRFGRLDVLVNNVGASDRGTVENLAVSRLQEVVMANIVPTLLCSQVALPLLQQRRGVVINIGSLAAKVGARYLGAYPAAKHALAGLTQQMRLEWKPKGVHVGLMNPGPIRRDDAGKRYAEQVAADESLPEQARKPGGGTRVRGLPAEVVAKRVLKMIQRRRPDVLLPGYLRPLVAIGHFVPPLGDWLLLKFTSSKSSDLR